MRMTVSKAAFAALLLLIAAGCQKGEEAAVLPPRSEILKDVPTVAASSLRDTTGGEDAERRTYRVQMSMDSVRMFFKDTLPALGWSIIGEQADTMLVSLYARRPGQALWVRIARPPLPPNVRVLSGGSVDYTLIASADTTNATPPASAATDTSKH